MPGARTSRRTSSTRAEGARQRGWLIVWATVAALVWTSAAAEETVLRIESRPGVSEVMVLTPGRMGSESVAAQGGAKNVVIVLEGGGGQIWIGKTADGPGIEAQVRWHTLTTVADARLPRPGTRRECSGSAAHGFHGSEVAVMAAVAQWINTGTAPGYINQEKAQ